MTPNRLVARLGAVSLAAALLALPACQGEPDPIPTATLPTPTAGHASPTPSPTPVSDFDEALEAYVAGKQVADALYRNGGSSSPDPKLEPYFSGSYLDLVAGNVRQYKHEGLKQEGEPEILRLVFWDGETVQPDGDDSRATFGVCLDYSNVTVQYPDGEVLNRGFTYALDTVYMLKRDDGAWKADDVSSDDLASMEEGQCAAP